MNVYIYIYIYIYIYNNCVYIAITCIYIYTCTLQSFTILIWNVALRINFTQWRICSVCFSPAKFESNSPQRTKGNSSPLWTQSPGPQKATHFFEWMAMAMVRELGLLFISFLISKLEKKAVADFRCLSIFPSTAEINCPVAFSTIMCTTFSRYSTMIWNHPTETKPC